jgi:hypothetical protein
MKLMPVPDTPQLDTVPLRESQPLLNRGTVVSRARGGGKVA